MNEIEVKRVSDRDKVIPLFLQGNPSVKIARTLGLKPGYVLDLIDEYKAISRSDNATKDHARELLSGMAEHYSMLIRKAYEVVEEVDTQGPVLSPQLLSQKIGALKLIAELEQKRLDSFHRAGLMDDEELATEVVETERKIEQLKELMLNVSAECDHCRIEIARGLSRIFNEAVPVVKVEPVV